MRALNTSAVNEVGVDLLIFLQRLQPCTAVAPQRAGLHITTDSSCFRVQGLMLYTALVSASTPVALRYLYLTPHPPTAVVLASIQTAFGAAILCLITGAPPGVL